MARFARLEERVAIVDNRVAAIESHLTALYTRVAVLEARQRATEATHTHLSLYAPLTPARTPTPSDACETPEPNGDELAHDTIADADDSTEVASPQAQELAAKENETVQVTTTRFGAALKALGLANFWRTFAEGAVAEDTLIAGAMSLCWYRRHAHEQQKDQGSGLGLHHAKGSRKSSLLRL
ncbi:hypothetical protein HPB49_016343 [Dermacentor silvarum]|uniref:Uncharacterized protein n=1 Tax=Dermacentor silvarum TaxID=543639 RepID=A0ACB8CLR4_DERSI|nr:hypothetical protein HPB49_016343 [Dermacentor silvarum]